MPQETFDAVRARMMVDGRDLTALDVAETVHFPGTPASDPIQAQTVVVDGGASLRG